MRCPSCSEENLQGADRCEACGTDLRHMDSPEARGGFRGKLLSDHLTSLDWDPPLVVSPEASAAEAVSVMREHGHGAVLVEDARGELVGIFSERDVVRRLVRPGVDPTSVTVASVMTPDPLVVNHEEPPAHAIHIMSVRGKRHVPILRDGKPAGVVSARNILRYLHDEVLGG